MRTLERSLRGNGASAPIDEGAHAIGVVGVPGDSAADGAALVVSAKQNAAEDVTRSLTMGGDRKPTRSRISSNAESAVLRGIYSMQIRVRARQQRRAVILHEWVQRHLANQCCRHRGSTEVG
ncbi:hypothetical protein [Ancylobacter sp. FA202]|uniref:hypothetical protein n=1 Tax=Ancylobacter sp. FA202 TaxID=1111106 RepID=UPI0012DD54AD